MSPERTSQWAWRVEPQLHRNLTTAQQTDEDFEAHYQAQDAAFLIGRYLDICQDEEKLGMSQTLARWHLAAYLEAPCYQAARDRVRAFRDFQNSQQTWEDYLYIGQTLTNDPQAIERIYRSYTHQTQSLETHFQLSLASLIRDIFHQQTGQGKYSIWYSLKITSNLKLKEKLQDLGEPQAKIAQCLDARKCLFETHDKSGKRWREPTAEQYREAARFCSRHCFAIDTAGFKHLIQICLRALQTTPKFGYFGEEIETLPTPASERESPTLQKEKEDLNTHLRNALDILEKHQENKTLLLLRLGLELSGTSIGTQLGINQSTVCRHLLRLQRKLLNAALTYLTERIDLNETMIAQTQNYIELWLQQHYQQQLNAILQKSWRDRVSSKQKELLTLRYFQHRTENAIAQQQKQTPRQISDALIAAKEPLILDVLSWVETTLDLSLEGERKRIERAVEKWLKES